MVTIYFDKQVFSHLFKAKEALGMRLAVLHNLYFYNTLMEKIKKVFIRLMLVKLAAQVIFNIKTVF